MRGALGGLLMLAASLCGQPAVDEKAARLTSTLLALKDADTSSSNLSERLAGDILALAASDREPARTTVLSFATELARALNSKRLLNSDAALLQRSISDVLRGVSATFISASNVRQVLGRVGVESSQAQVVTKRFVAIGEEIRGPDDLRVLKALKPK